MVDQLVKNLANVLNNESVVIKVQHPPSFLIPFIDNNDGEIIFIYKQKEEPETLITHRKKSNETEFSEDLDLTGHPLECPFSIDGDNDQSTILVHFKAKESDMYCPLTIHEARQILSVNNLHDGATIPIYVLIDGMDNNHTVVLSSKKNNGWHTQSWITFHKCDTIQFNESSLQTMIQQHDSLSQIQLQHLQTEVSCTYLIEHIDDNPSTLLQECPGHIELHILWKTPSIDIPLHEASTNIVIHSVIGHESSEILQLWKQVLHLNNLLQLTKQWKEERSLQQPYSRRNIVYPNMLQFMDEEVSKTRTPSERLHQLLTEPDKFVGDIGLMFKEDHKISNRLSQVASNLIEERKTEQEFTDQLWGILMELASYQDVSSSFESVFKHVKNGSCRPYIKSTNVSRLSHALRCYKRDPSSNMELMLEPIEMLIEIGIEKLKKDYISMFLITKIATLEQLCIPSLPKFIDISASDWDKACSSWILWFVRMHATLEMVLLVENMLKLENSAITITGGILKFYLGETSPLNNLDNLSVIPPQDFNMSVNTRDVQNHLRNGRPFNSWRLKMNSQIPHRSVKSVFFRSYNEIFPSYVYDDDDDDKYDPMSCTHVAITEHCYSYHSISNRLL